MVISGWDLFWTVIAAIAAAALVGSAAWIGAAAKKRNVAPTDQVTAGSAWAPQDSWITNIGAITGTLAGAWATLGNPAAPLVNAPKISGAVGILFLAFAGAAVLAPVVYAAFAAACPEAEEVTGTVVGYVLSAMTTVFAIMGELAALGLFVLKVGPNLPSQISLLSLIGIGAIVIVVYAIRTMNNVLADHTVKPEKPTPASDARPRQASFLVSSSPTNRRRSATL